MTVLIFTNTGYHENLKEYARVIEEKLGKKLNYDKERDFYYYLIYSLDDLLDIIKVMPYDCIISKDVLDRNEYNEYILEVYDDWRE